MYTMGRLCIFFSLFFLRGERGDVDINPQLSNVWELKTHPAMLGRGSEVGSLGLPCSPFVLGRPITHRLNGVVCVKC